MNFSFYFKIKENFKCSTDRKKLMNRNQSSLKESFDFLFQEKKLVIHSQSDRPIDWTASDTKKVKGQHADAEGAVNNVQNFVHNYRICNACLHLKWATLRGASVNLPWTFVKQMTRKRISRVVQILLMSRIRSFHFSQTTLILSIFWLKLITFKVVRDASIALVQTWICKIPPTPCNQRRGFELTR